MKNLIFTALFCTTLASFGAMSSATELRAAELDNTARSSNEAVATASGQKNIETADQIQSRRERSKALSKKAMEELHGLNGARKGAGPKYYELKKQIKKYEYQIFKLNQALLKESNV